MLPSQFPCQFSWYARRNVPPSPYTLRDLPAPTFVSTANPRTHTILAVGQNVKTSRV